jgi:phage terminase large subunit
MARSLLIRGLRRKQLFLCAREYQVSIRQSVHRLLEAQINLLGLQGEYDVQRTTVVNRRNGTEFIFAGLHHNVDNIRSIEGIDVCWIEEGETISEESWRVLDPTVRGDDGEIWVSFNPKLGTDPTYVRMVGKSDKDHAGRLPGCVSRKVSWKDNPWLSKRLRAQAEYMRENNPEAYLNVWEGELWSKNDAQVMNGKWCIASEPIIALPEWNGPYFGADWGFAQDPNVLTKSYIHSITPPGALHVVDGEEYFIPQRKRLYVTNAEYEVGCDIINTPAMFDRIPQSRKYLIYADNARPETISHMKHAGFMIEPCEKWPGSVQDGITFLRGFEQIVIDPSLTELVDEMRFYSHKVDKLTSRVLPELVKGFDHGIDSLRYAMGPMITRTPNIFDSI